MALNSGDDDAVRSRLTGRPRGRVPLVVRLVAMARRSEGFGR